jgi:hypothetical protein
MAHSTRSIQSTSSRSLLLDLYKQRDNTSSTAKLIRIQASIDHIIAQNYLNYVNS